MYGVYGFVYLHLSERVIKVVLGVGVFTSFALETEQKLTLEGKITFLDVEHIRREGFSDWFQSEDCRFCLRPVGCVYSANPEPRLLNLGHSLISVVTDWAYVRAVPFGLDWDGGTPLQKCRTLQEVSAHEMFRTRNARRDYAEELPGLPAQDTSILLWA